MSTTSRNFNRQSWGCHEGFLTTVISDHWSNITCNRKEQACQRQTNFVPASQTLMSLHGKLRTCNLHGSHAMFS